MPISWVGFARGCSGPGWLSPMRVRVAFQNSRAERTAHDIVAALGRQIAVSSHFLAAIAGHRKPPLRCSTGSACVIGPVCTDVNCLGFCSGLVNLADALFVQPIHPDSGSARHRSDPTDATSTFPVA